LASGAPEVSFNYEVSVISETIDAMAERNLVSKKAAQATRRKARTIRKVKNAQCASAPSLPQAAVIAETQPTIGDPNVRSRLEKGIAELQGLHELLLSSEVDCDVLADLRNALNRVRNTAWVAQQYVIRKESDQDSTSVLALLAGERIRAAYQLCRALSDDFARTDIEFQRGSLVELYDATKTLTEGLKGVIDKV
jgi:hypothetical protein